MVPINKRNIATCILLTVITGGIYGIYWYYLLVKNIKAIKNDSKKCTGEMLCLILVPFYSVYWWYTRGRDVKDLLKERNYSTAGNEIVYLLLALHGLGIISMALMQNDFNAIPCKNPGALSRQSTAITPSKWTILAYLCIPVLLFAFTVFVPLIIAVVNSFYDWRIGAPKVFTGLSNYGQLFQDSAFWSAFGRNIYLVIVCIIGQMGIAFVLVLFANSKLTRAKGIHRTFGFFPSTISAVCIGMIWFIILDQRGLINVVLSNFGLLSKKWMEWPNYLGGDNAMLWVTIPLVWQYIGYYMVIMFSAIAGIDTEIFESAEIDGANGFQKALYITMPLIKNTLLVCLTLCIAGNMKAFDNIWVMTAGGHNTTVMALYSYDVSMQQHILGYGNTVSVGIFVVSLAVIGGSQWIIKRLTRGVEA